MRAAAVLFSTLFLSVALATPAVAGDYASNGAEAESPEAQPPLPESSGGAMQSAQEKVTDAWITAKVKSMLMYSKNVTVSGIKVETIDGIVTLSGKVDADSAKDRATEIASTVNGVRKVNSNDLLVRNRDGETGDSIAH